MVLSALPHLRAWEMKYLHSGQEGLFTDSGFPLQFSSAKFIELNTLVHGCTLSFYKNNFDPMKGQCLEA